MDYATVSLADVSAGLDRLARQAQANFGGYNARQLNWRPDPKRWSIAQCFDHLLTANQLMMAAADRALDDQAPRTVWQRMPLLPGLFGRLLVRSQAPGGTRRFSAPASAQPAASDIPADVIPRFVDQHGDLVQRLQTLDDARAARTIMTSPFVNVITYSVLDGWRLLLAHDLRHIEQARQVTLSPAFPFEG